MQQATAEKNSLENKRLCKQGYFAIIIPSCLQAIMLTKYTTNHWLECCWSKKREWKIWKIHFIWHITWKKSFFFSLQTLGLHYQLTMFKLHNLPKIYFNRARKVTHSFFTLGTGKLKNLEKNLLDHKANKLYVQIKWHSIWNCTHVQDCKEFDACYILIDNAKWKPKLPVCYFRVRVCLSFYGWRLGVFAFLWSIVWSRLLALYHLYSSSQVILK